MAETDVLKTRGEPANRTVTHGLGTPQWEYADGLIVFLRFPDAGPLVLRVWRLGAQPPFAGATSEGFHLGDSMVDLRRRYAGFAITAPDPNQLVVKDSRGTMLGAIFESERAKTLVLQGP